ncbi:DUF5996 family protein [Sphingosinicella sp. LHD-64]|uniref:DUF5996 family protein n=1 Tax=Sphingosinicella sp. LHD-64 TaxID=3072139 RepID=UPI00280FB870|nr:DUF5996 family protein [Sphingosinicella sp. LHD-64]MDQ8755855.1 DUF5996 family protein [Sphingosinicella sp. LHD-64]
MANDPRWPALSAERDGPTIAALHLFSQVIGKVPTAVLPWRNHGWHLTLHVGPRGLSTEPVHAEGGTFTLAFDLAGHQIVYEDTSGRATAPLASMSVADFHRSVFDLLKAAGHDIAIHAAPNEIDPAIPFDEDTAPRTYDPASARRLLGALLSADRVFRLFRSSFLGKVSPVHFFWGSFDLAVTRFSGRTAPRHPGGIPNLPDDVTREAYSHEVSSAGFWPGGAGGPGGPFFYSYAYPTPDGFAAAKVAPEAARFDTTLGEFILDYEAVRTAPDPDAALLAFLDSTYAAAADLAGWDRAALECATGHPGIPRAV